MNNSLAEVSKEGYSLAIGNGALMNAIANMIQLQRDSKDTADRQEYIKKANLIYAWARPNEGVGNPHTKVIKE